MFSGEELLRMRSVVSEAKGYLSNGKPYAEELVSRLENEVMVPLRREHDALSKIYFESSQGG